MLCRSNWTALRVGKCRRLVSIWAGLALASGALAACSTGPGDVGGATPAMTLSELDTAKPPPQTVTSTPLLPPVPDEEHTTAQTTPPP